VEGHLHEILTETFLALFADEPAVRARFFAAKALSAAQDGEEPNGESENGEPSVSEAVAKSGRRTSIVAGIRRRLSRASTGEEPAGEKSHRQHGACGILIKQKTSCK